MNLRQHTHFPRDLQSNARREQQQDQHLDVQQEAHKELYHSVVAIDKNRSASNLSV
jgi:hypothetical protein